MNEPVPSSFRSPGMFPKDALSVAQTQPREIAAPKKKNSPKAIGLKPKK